MKIERGGNKYEIIWNEPKKKTLKQWSKFVGQCCVSGDLKKFLPETLSVYTYNV